MPKKTKTATKAKAETIKQTKKKSVSRRASSRPAAVGVGDLIPDFRVLGTEGEFRLSEHRGRRLVFFFYPKDATPGCTLEGRDFSRLHARFARLGVEVYGVSRDTISSHERYKVKEGFRYDLLSDQDEKVCRLFDVIREKNMYGRKVMGIERSTFILDEKGRISREWRKVSVAGHAEEVLEALLEEKE